MPTSGPDPSCIFHLLLIAVNWFADLHLAKELPVTSCASHQTSVDTKFRHLYSHFASYVFPLELLDNQGHFPEEAVDATMSR